MKKELIFLGSSGAIQVPSFHCNCETCEESRKNPGLKRSRASLALIGKENILIDASPDIEYQLEREKIRYINRIFLTHWHYDHCWGLGAFGEPGSHGIWKQKVINLYLPEQYIQYFNRDFIWLKNRYKLFPLRPGDLISLDDAIFEVVKTDHTPESVGYIIQTNNSKFAYLVDGIVPPEKTINRLQELDLDLIIIEGTLDELILPEGVKWKNFSIDEAVAFWKSLNIPKCILTHLSCHKWAINKIAAGLSSKERQNYAKSNPGLKFAYDGLRIDI